MKSEKTSSPTSVPVQGAGLSQDQNQLKFDGLFSSLDRHALTRHWLFVLAVTLLTAVKLFRLGSRELWLDESYSALLAGMPFRQMMQFVVNDVHPPLFYLLLSCWVRIFGISEPALRLFSVTLSAFATAGIYFAVRAWLGRKPACYATLLFALSPMLYYYSLEIRMYMLAICWMIAIVAVYGRIIHSRGNTRLNLILYASFCSLLYYTHYIGLFLLAGIFLDSVIVSGFRRDALLRLTATWVLVGILIGPWLPIMLQQRARKDAESHARIASFSDPAALTFGGVMGQSSVASSVVALVRNAAVAAGLYPASAALTIVLGIPLIIVILLVLRLAAKGDPPCRLFVVAGMAVFVGAIYLGTLTTRHILPLLPLLFLAMARAIQVSLATRWRLPAAAMAASLILLYAGGFVRKVTARNPRPWTNLVAAVQSHYTPGDVIVFDALYAQVLFDYYAGQAGFHPVETGFPESVFHWWARQPFKGWGGPVVTQEDLSAAVRRLQTLYPSRTVWLVQYENVYYDPKEAFAARLEEAANLHQTPIAPIVETDRGVPAAESLRVIPIPLKGNSLQPPIDVSRRP